MFIRDDRYIYPLTDGANHRPAGWSYAELQTLNSLRQYLNLSHTQFIEWIKSLPQYKSMRRKELEVQILKLEKEINSIV